MDVSILFILTLLVTLFTLILIPVYWKTYGLANFLWLSDIGLFLTVFALWFHSSLLISINSILILPFEVIWIIDYLYRLITQRNFLGVVGYMFNSKHPFSVRALSLFHIVLPILWVWCLYLWGYNRHAPWYAVILVWIVLLLTYFFTNPKENINWVHVPAYQKWNRIPGYLWLIFLLIGFPVFIIFPMHFLLLYLFKG